ncbi:ATP-dependent DNA helicase [Trichinella spiralis]|uniref:ATP-dependent DNA helicase n=1 Tax=Trichinella spiralis TaxID=6334 RepID=UPI0001EFBD65|nr:ATP-dependent DNA helicase [Trichinella spiralis]
MRGSDKVLVKVQNAFLYTCGNDFTASRSDAQLYRELELPPNLLKTRGQENFKILWRRRRNCTCVSRSPFCRATGAKINRSRWCIGGRDTACASRLVEHL